MFLLQSLLLLLLQLCTIEGETTQPAHEDNVNDMLLQHNEIEMQEYPAFLSIEETEL